MSLLWQGIRCGAAGVLLALVACGSGEEILPPQRNDPVQEWRFDVSSRAGEAVSTLPPPNQGVTPTGGSVEESVSFGQSFNGSDLVFRASRCRPTAPLGVRCFPPSANGVNYAMSAEAPFAPENGEPDADGGRTTLKQMQSHVKRATDAGLTLTATHEEIEIRDHQPPPNPARPVLAGGVEFQLPNGDFTIDFAVARFNANSSPDASFGTAGTASAALSENATASGKTLQADGKLVVVGTRASSANADFFVARFDTNGRLNTGFGNPDTLSIDFFRFDEIGENVLVQPPGKVVVSGQAKNSVNGYVLARINP